MNGDPQHEEKPADPAAPATPAKEKEEGQTCDATKTEKQGSCGG